MNIYTKLNALALTVCVSGMIGLGSTAGADTLQDILDVQESANKYAQQSQEKIDDITDDTRQIVAEYRQVLRQIESTQIYNAQIQRLIDRQNEKIQSLNDDIARVTSINREITPLMLEMLDGLERFVKADVPFRKQERLQRVQNLREMMDRADVSTAEKFRRVLEAYQIENEYGRTVEAYSGTLEKEGQTLQVDFLQIGRVAFLYVTGDDSEAGVWDNSAGADGAWVPVDDSMISSIRQGISIALDQTTPDLITLPIKAPENAQ